MGDNASANLIIALVAIAVGLLTCFWGYRILKFVLVITGLIAGAIGGWSVGLSPAPGNPALALAGAVVGGIIGAALCFWLYFFGVFLLGASAGAAVAGALFSAAGNQPQPLLILLLALIFGLIALVLQKLMIIVSSAFSGAYLVTAGLLHFINGGQIPFPAWFGKLPAGSSGYLGYAAFAFWLVLGFVGVAVQYRGSPSKAEVESQPS